MVLWALSELYYKGVLYLKLFDAVTYETWESNNMLVSLYPFPLGKTIWECRVTQVLNDSTWWSDTPHLNVDRSEVDLPKLYVYRLCQITAGLKPSSQFFFKQYMHWEYICFDPRVTVFTGNDFGDNLENLFVSVLCIRAVYDPSGPWGVDGVPTQPTVTDHMNGRVSSPGQGHKSRSTWLLHLTNSTQKCIRAHR